MSKLHEKQALRLDSKGFYLLLGPMVLLNNQADTEENKKNKFIISIVIVCNSMI